MFHERDFELAERFGVRMSEVGGLTRALGDLQQELIDGAFVFRGMGVFGEGEAVYSLKGVSGEAALLYLGEIALNNGLYDKHQSEKIVRMLGMTGCLIREAGKPKALIEMTKDPKTEGGISINATTALAINWGEGMSQIEIAWRGRVRVLEGGVWVSSEGDLVVGRMQRSRLGKAYRPREGSDQIMKEKKRGDDVIKRIEKQSGVSVETYGLLMLVSFLKKFVDGDDLLVYTDEAYPGRYELSDEQRLQMSDMRSMLMRLGLSEQDFQLDQDRRFWRIKIGKVVDLVEKVGLPATGKYTSAYEKLLIDLVQS